MAKHALYIFRIKKYNSDLIQCGVLPIDLADYFIAKFFGFLLDES